MKNKKKIIFLIVEKTAQAFSEGGDPPSTPLLPRRPPWPPPLTLIKNEGEGIKSLLSNTIIFFQGKQEYDKIKYIIFKIWYIS